MALPSIPLCISATQCEVSLRSHLIRNFTDGPLPSSTSFQTDTTVDEPVPTSPPPSPNSDSDLVTTTQFLTSFSTTSTPTDVPPITTSRASLQLSDSLSAFVTPMSSITGLHIASTIVTTIDGIATTISSQILLPTTLASSNASRGSDHIAAIVASTLGFVSLLILVLSIIFFIRHRRQRKKYSLIEAVTDRRNQQFSRVVLLHGEDLDDNTFHGAYRHDGAFTGDVLPTDIQSLGMGSVHSSSPPILLRARGSETGSIFHEDVWPPPGESSRLVDPLSKASSEVDLSSIVDDVMGPAEGEVTNPIADSSSPPSPTSPESPTYRHQQRSSSSSNQIYDWSNMSRTRLLPSDSSGSFVQTAPRNSSPLARNSIDTISDYASLRDSRTWLDRSPTKRTPKLGQYA